MTTAAGRDRPPRAATWAVLALVVATALVPWPGRWALLKTVVPLLIVVAFVRRLVAASGESTWSALGLAWPPRTAPRVLAGAVLGIGLYGLELVTVRPLGRRLFDQPSEIGGLRMIEGSLMNLAVALVFMWLLAAIGEEVIWRGFVFRRLGALLGGGRGAWVLAMVVSSAIFGALHAFQGPRGMMRAAIGGMILCALYWAIGRRSLWLPILVHGTKNTVSFVLIYLGLYDAVINRF